MQGKITLITPPDFFENENMSLMFVHLSDEDQFKVSEWFGKANLDKNINIYFYNDETNVEWFLYALNRCTFKFVDINRLTSITTILLGHILAKTNLYYKTDDVNTHQICQYLNNNRIINIEDFLEKAFNVKDRNETRL